MELDLGKEGSSIECAVYISRSRDVDSTQTTGDKLVSDLDMGYQKQAYSHNIRQPDQ